jgi:hypothetical protein
VADLAADQDLLSLRLGVVKPEVDLANHRVGEEMKKAVTEQPAAYVAVVITGHIREDRARTWAFA